LQYWGRSNIHQHWFAVGLRFGQKFFNVAFCSYLHHQYFNWAAVPGGRISNPPTSQSPIVVRNLMTHFNYLTIFFLTLSLSACSQMDNPQNLTRLKELSEKSGIQMIVIDEAEKITKTECRLPIFSTLQKYKNSFII
jgi:hypothetical protein